MLSASSVLMDVLENQSNPGIREEQLSLQNAEMLSLGDSSPRSTLSSSLIEIEEASEDQRRQPANTFHFQNHHHDSDQEEEEDEEFNQFVLMEHCYDEEEEEEPEEENIQQVTSYHHHEDWKLKPSPPKSKPLQTKEEFKNTSHIQPKEHSPLRSSSRTSFLRGTTTTTLTRNSSALNGSFGFGSTASRFSFDSPSNHKPKASPSFKRDLELENELLGKHNNTRPTTPTSKPIVRSTSPISKTSINEEVIYTPPSDLSSITLKDKKEIEKTVERLKVRQRYLEDRVKRESTPPKGRVLPPKPRVYISSERVITKPLYEKEQVLTLTQLKHSLEVEQRKKRIEEKRKELQDSKNLRARQIREEKQKRENYLKEDSFLSRPGIQEIKRPATPSLTKRSTTPTNYTKRPNSGFVERAKSSITIETVNPQRNNLPNSQQPKSSNKAVPRGVFTKQNSFLSDSTYKSQKDAKDFNALLKEQEKLLNNIRELKNKIQPSSKK